MSLWLHCDCCEAFVRDEHPIGWVRIDHQQYIATYGELPIEHVCPACWAKMMKAMEQ